MTVSMMIKDSFDAVFSNHDNKAKEQNDNQHEELTNDNKELHKET